MTEQLYSESRRKILINKKQIENSLKVKIKTEKGMLLIEGKPEDELIAQQVIEAMSLGFSVTQALDLKNDEFTFQKIEIKSVSRRNDMSQIRARIIGTHGKALKNLEFLSGCDIVIHENHIGVIGHHEDVKKAVYALKKLIGGSKHANVYAYLEDENAKQRAGIW